MPTAHLIVGSTGAGKTTYAKTLADDLGALRFTVDEWMHEFFWPDAPEPLTHAWALERVERCERHALALAGQVLALDGTGPDVILDFGFFTREQRARLSGALRDQGWAVRVHYLDVDAAERWRRVDRRNAEQGDTYALQVTRGMFDFCEDLFEAPTEDELAEAVIHR